MRKLIRHKKTNKVYIYRGEQIWFNTLRFTDPADGIYKTIVRGHANNGRILVDYWCINPKTGQPWQATKHGWLEDFEDVEQVAV